MKTYRPPSAALAAALLAAGCRPGPPDDAPPAPAPVFEHGEDHADDAHPVAGPHGGPLIELGDEEYHAELIHDDEAGTVTVYLLDGRGDGAAATDAAELTLNFTRDGVRKSFALAADPKPGDPAGAASRFVSADAALAEELDRAGGGAKLAVRIAGRSYSGALAHDHAAHTGGTH